MNNLDIINISMEQSALESGCKPEDFKKMENIVVESVSKNGCRRYLELPYICDLTTYGTNIVASVKKDYMPYISNILERYPFERIQDAPIVNEIDRFFREKGLGVGFLAAYYLPDVNLLKDYKSDFDIKMLEKDDFDDLYTEDWKYALDFNERERNVLGVGAYNPEGKLIGLAACTEDCASMWQIGINVLSSYHSKGIASCLTKRLALEIIDRGKVPFYRAPWCNIASVRNAIKSGFKPAWCQVTIKKMDFIDNMLDNLQRTGRG